MFKNLFNRNKNQSNNKEESKTMTFEEIINSDKIIRPAYMNVAAQREYKRMNDR